MYSSSINTWYYWYKRCTCVQDLDKSHTVITRKAYYSSQVSSSYIRVIFQISKFYVLHAEGHIRGPYCNAIIIVVHAGGHIRGPGTS